MSGGSRRYIWMSSVCLVLGGAREAGISTVVFIKVQSEAEELQTLF